MARPALLLAALAATLSGAVAAGNLFDPAAPATWDHCTAASLNVCTGYQLVRDEAAEGHRLRIRAPGAAGLASREVTGLSPTGDLVIGFYAGSLIRFSPDRLRVR